MMPAHGTKLLKGCRLRAASLSGPVYCSADGVVILFVGRGRCTCENDRQPPTTNESCVQAPGSLFGRLLVLPLMVFERV